jgi:hypothetical protein
MKPLERNLNLTKEASLPCDVGALAERADFFGISECGYNSCHTLLKKTIRPGESDKRHSAAPLFLLSGRTEALV